MKTSKGFLNGSQPTSNRTSNVATFSDTWNSKRRHH
jgi:hypothetical protein